MWKRAYSFKIEGVVQNLPLLSAMTDLLVSGLLMQVLFYFGFQTMLSLGDIRKTMFTRNSTDTQESGISIRSFNFEKLILLVELKKLLKHDN